jgi:hypothetical protein
MEGHLAETCNYTLQPELRDELATAILHLEVSRCCTCPLQDTMRCCIGCEVNQLLYGVRCSACGCGCGGTISYAAVRLVFCAYTRQHPPSSGRPGSHTHLGL